MASNGIATHGDSIQQSTASSHINTKYWVSGTEYTSGYYQPSTKNATITGTIENTTNTVYANNKRVCVKDNNTKESDSYNLGSHEYVSGSHTNSTSGKITSGSSNVYCGGKPVARKTSTVNTHANTTSSITGGSSNVFVS